ncbi:hypothetical protein BDN72DRAFT_725448, partial [Pluteus cervinus]
ALANTFHKHAYNIEHVLSPYFPDCVDSFQSIQESTGALVSGSVALQFFSRVVYEDCDLDIYIQNGHEGPLQDWLQEAGY